MVCNPNNCLLERAADPTGDGLTPARTPPTPTVTSPGCQLSFSPTSCRWETLTSPILGMVNLLERCTQLKQTFTLLSSKCRFIIKGYNRGYRRTSSWNWCVGQGMWEGRRVSIPSAGVHQLRSSPSPLFEIFMEVSIKGHDWSLSSFLALFPSQENGGQGWKFQDSNNGLVFPVTSPHPGTHAESPHWNKIHSCHQTIRISGDLC